MLKPGLTHLGIRFLDCILGPEHNNTACARHAVQHFAEGCKIAHVRSKNFVADPLPVFIGYAGKSSFQRSEAFCIGQLILIPPADSTNDALG